MIKNLCIFFILGCQGGRWCRKYLFYVD